MSTQTVTPDGFANALNNVLERFDQKSVKSANMVLRETVKNMFGTIIEDTPVGDFDPDHAGTLKGGWQLTVGSPASGRTGKRSSRRTRDDLNVPNLITKTGAKRVFLTNNEPYINVVEYGGYVANPKRGTFDKRTGRFVVRSKGGFSKQAPKGMVRRTMNKSKRFLEVAANKVLGF